MNIDSLIVKFESLKNKIMSLSDPKIVSLAHKEANEFISNPKFNVSEIRDKMRSLISPNASLKDRANFENNSMKIIDIGEILIREQLKIGRNHLLACFLSYAYCVSNMLYILFRREINNEDVEYIVDKCINDPLVFFITAVLKNIIQVLLITITLGIFGGVGGKIVGSFSGIVGADAAGAEMFIMGGNVALNICILCILVSTIIKYKLISNELKNENSTKKEISGINVGRIKLNKLGNFEANAVFNNAAY